MTKKVDSRGCLNLQAFRDMNGCYFLIFIYGSETVFAYRKNKEQSRSALETEKIVLAQ